MSTLRVDALQDRTGAGMPAMAGTAKAWVNFNGTGTVAIRAAFNVSSITDNGAGDYTVNFTTPMQDTNYSLAGFCRQPSDTPVGFGAAGPTMSFGGSGEFQTSSCRIRAGSKLNSSGSDTDTMCLTVFR